MTSAESRMRKFNPGPKFSMSLSEIQGKPSMPTSTPSPGPQGRLNPYSTLLEPNIQGSVTTKVEKNESFSTSNAAASKAIQKIIAKLPYDVRERVTSLVNMSLFSAENYQKQYEALRLELIALKGQHKRKITEYQQLNQRCDIYREQVANLEEKLGALEDDAESRQSYALRNQKAISRLSSTNKTLIDTYSLLGEGGKSGKNRAGSVKDQRRRTITPNDATSAASSPNQGRRRGTASPMVSRPETPAAIDDKGSVASGLNNGIDQEISVTKNEKLREHMLRFAKEHNRVVKNVENLEFTLQTLRASLRYAERRNRQLQLELDEIKDNQSLDSGTGPEMVPPPMAEKGQKKTSEKKSAEKKSTSENQSSSGRDTASQAKKAGERMDTRLSELVLRNAFDPMEGIKQMDGIVAHLSQTPCNLVESEVCMHLCSRKACRLLDTECIAMFVLQPGGEFMFRYMTGKQTVEKIRVGEIGSIAELVIRNGSIKRYNTLKQSKNQYFNVDIDGGGESNVKRVLCTPIRESGHGRVIGAIELLNRIDSEKFSEVDELFTAVYGEMAGGLVSPCLLFNRVRSEAVIVNSIIQAQVQLNAALPEKETICAMNPLDVGEVLYHAEVSFRDALQCAKVKVYIPGRVMGESESYFVSLEADAVSMKGMKRSQLSTHTTPIESGIVGLVARTKSPYLVRDPASDPYFNPQVDIDSPVESFYCIPIFDFNDQVIACVSAVPSPLSPLLDSEQAKADPCVLSFENACQWLGYSVSMSLANIIAAIGKPSSRPSIVLESITLTEKLSKVPLNLKPARDFVSKKRAASVKTVTLAINTCDSNAETSDKNSPTETGRGGSSFLDYPSFCEDDTIVENEKDDLEMKLAELQAEIQELKAANQSSKNSSVAADNAARDKEVADLLKKLETEATEHAKTVQTLEKQIAALQQRVESMESVEDASVLGGFLDIVSVRVKGVEAGQFVNSVIYSLNSWCAHAGLMGSPFLVAELKLGDGSAWHHFTGAQPLVKSKSKWDTLAFTGKINQSQILVDSMVIRVKDSASADKLIGKAYMSVSDLLDQTSVWTTLRGPLLDKEGKGACGEYVVRARYRLEGEEESFESAAIEDDSDVEVEVQEANKKPVAEENPVLISGETTGAAVDEIADEDPDAGYLEVSVVKLTNLKNIGKPRADWDNSFLTNLLAICVLEIFGKQDPFVELKLGDGSRWKHATVPLKDAGEKAKWRDLSFSGKIRQYQLYDEDITLRVKDRNEGAVDKFIGKADIIASSLLDSTNAWIELSGNLFDKNGDDIFVKFMIRTRFRMSNEEAPVDDFHYDSDMEPPVPPTAEKIADEVSAPDVHQGVTFAGHLADQDANEGAKNLSAFNAEQIEKSPAEETPGGILEVRAVKLSNLKYGGKSNREIMDAI